MEMELPRITKPHPVLGDIPLLNKAHVYTQVIKFSQVLTETPPNPQFWGNKSSQSPPGTPKVGGHGGGGFRGLNRLK